jgi:8-oxo-dGTP pyrophosphatase MutT (NUDIX family)
VQRAQVEGLLLGHEPQDDVEHAALARLRTAFAASPAPFDKHSFAPGHVTCSAFAVSPDHERVLLIHHAAFGLWIQPGGHVDPSDASPEAAARRELAEETALDRATLLFDGLLDVDVHEVPDGIKGQPAHLHLDLRFAFQAATEEIAAGSDAADARWFALAALDRVDTDASVRLALSRLRSRLASR